MCDGETAAPNQPTLPAPGLSCRDANNSSGTAVLARGLKMVVKVVNIHSDVAVVGFNWRRGDRGS